MQCNVMNCAVLYGTVTQCSVTWWYYCIMYIIMNFVNVINVFDLLHASNVINVIACSQCNVLQCNAM